MPAGRAFLNLTLALGMSMYAPTKKSHVSTTLAQSSIISRNGVTKSKGNSFCMAVDMNICNPPEHIIRIGRMIHMAR